MKWKYPSKGQMPPEGCGYPMETYKNCKLKVADFTEDEAQFTFEYGGTITAECRMTPRTYEMMGYMRDLKPIDITIENGVIKAVTEHKD